MPLLQAMYDEWPFFRGMLDLVEMVMAKADPKVTAMYDAKLVRPELQVRDRVERGGGGRAGLGWGVASEGLRCGGWGGGLGCI
jgi:hypothetical protein